jgi:enamine deaminase RidA (YjgF/YER057c/UK114 family)
VSAVRLDPSGASVDKRYICAPEAPSPSGGYAQAVEIANPARMLYVSGQIPVSKDGFVPATFREQCQLAWRNLEAQLIAADMTLDNLVKVTIFLSDRRFGDENGTVRREILGERSPALTVIVAGIFDSAWLLEIEAVAAA